MAFFDKMKLVPIDGNSNTDDVIRIGLKLAEKGVFNDKLELKVDNDFIKDSNILEYINAIFNNKDLPYLENFTEYLEKIDINKDIIKNTNILKYFNTPKVYTTISPVAKKLNNTWIPYGD